MTYVAFEVATTKTVAKAATEAAAKAALTRYLKKNNMTDERAKFDVAEINDFYENIEKFVAKKNLMTCATYYEKINTPVYLSPACETYWSM